MHQWFKKCVTEGEYAHWIGLYLSFHLSWVLGPFVHGRLQNLSENTFGRDITPVWDFSLADHTLPTRLKLVW